MIQNTKIMSFTDLPTTLENVTGNFKGIILVYLTEFRDKVNKTGK